ncbi:MAG: ABC transporter permease [Bacteroidales bacterium]|nr:ABC transporter permease [Bacteroidales bacterium]
MPHTAIRWYYLLKESLESAYRTVMLNKLRTLLSLMGITIGIFAIISVYTALDSMEENIRESFSAMGDDIIYIEKWPWMPEDGQEYKWWEYLNRPVPKRSEHLLLKKKLENARALAFFASTQSTIKHGNASADNIPVWGATEEFEELRNFSIIKGRFFSPYEFHSG